MRAWPQIFALSLGIVPVMVLAGIVALMLSHSATAIGEIGIGQLFDNRFSSQYGTGANIYGLLPAIWGTVTVTVLAVVIAFPIAMAMALMATEFQLGIVGRAMRFLLGVLSGVPSIIYALAAFIFISTFMIPKFAADSSSVNDFTPQKIGAEGAWPPSDVPFNAGSMPWGSEIDPNSTLLGAALIALLIVPFLAPMLEDAIRGVPSAPREASLALGTSRWHTLRRVVLPYAAPGIISATALASLKAIGDVMIAIFVIGFEAPRLPTPLVDIVERNPPLTAVGANLLGGFTGASGCGAVSAPGSVVTSANFRCDTAYFSAFLLLIIAFVVVVAASYLQSRFRRRYAR